MRKIVRFGVVSIRDLSRNPGAVMDRIRRGERLIVCSHKRAVATLQPLNGCVVQPYEGAEYDVSGSPLGDVSAEAEKLSPIERDLLVWGQWRDRFSISRASSRWPLGQPIQPSLEAMTLRGLLRKTDRGMRLTGRGWMLREALVPDDVDGNLSLKLR